MTSSSAHRDKAPAKILVRGVNWLGDAIMSTPALLRLRQAQPDAEITLLTPAKLADLWPEHPALDAVLTFTKGESLWSLARRLREGRFQIGLVLPNSTRSALEICLARIPRRIGCAGRGRRWLLTERVPARPGAVPMKKRSRNQIQRLMCAPPACPTIALPLSAHHLYHYLHLASHLGARPEPTAPHIVIRPDEIQAFLLRWQLHNSAARPLLGLNPGAEYGPAKRWPAERFIAAAVEIQRRTQCRWIVLGGPSDAVVAQQITQGIIEGGARESRALPESGSSGALNLAGKTTLRELGAALQVCRVVLTNDTGPMHLAAAVGTPVVAPFGSTSAELTGPGLPGDHRHALLKANVPCSPCFLRECPIDFRCMTAIGVARVVEAVTKILQERS